MKIKLTKNENDITILILLNKILLKSANILMKMFAFFSKESIRLITIN